VIKGKIKVLIADNSGFVRLIMSDILNRESDIEVIGTAMDGDELLLKVNAWKPDVIIADIELPKNYNLFAMKRIGIKDRNRMILTGKEGRLNTSLVAEMNELGIKNILIKPENILQPQLRTISEEIIKKVRSVAIPVSESIKIAGLIAASRSAATRLAFAEDIRDLQKESRQIVVIGASSGGPAVIESILCGLDKDFPAPVLVAQHISSSFTNTFINRLRRASGLEVVEGEKGMKIKPGMVIVAPGDKNMVVKPGDANNGAATINFTNDINKYPDTPSIDLLMQSVAKVYNKNVLGVILTGLGRDGTSGAKAINSLGGTVIAQDKNTSAAFSMAKSAIDGGYVQKVLPPESIVKYIKRFIQMSSLQLNNTFN
jgi:two-component system, chemotaxis family, protein-glutamate methylesterase/glutaminase